MQKIESLEKVSFDVLFGAFNEAFGSYEVQIDREELKVMLVRRGFVPELSFGAFEDGKLVAFTLNGVGLYGGVKMAYDTGTGTLADYRGRGIAAKIFAYSLPFLKDAGVTQYLLEVLQHNTTAVSVYRNLGFTVSREFCYFKQLAAEVNIPAKALPEGYVLREMALDRREPLMELWDFIPSWQNSFEAISRSVEDYKIVGVYDNQQLAGYGVIEPNSGDITQLSVGRAYRRQGIGSVLLAEMLTYNRHHSVKVVNTEITCTSITAFLESCGIPLQGKQFEMVLEL